MYLKKFLTTKCFLTSSICLPVIDGLLFDVRPSEVDPAIHFKNFYHSVEMFIRDSFLIVLSKLCHQYSTKFSNTSKRRKVQD